MLSKQLQKGQKFNHLTVIRPVKIYKQDGIHYETQYECRCDCGNIITVRKSNLTRTLNATKSCGCLNNKNRHRKLVDLTHQHFGDLEVLYRADDYIAPKSGAHRAMWHCRCKCGTEKDIDGTVLKSGKVISCGCHSAKLAHDNKYMDLTNKVFDKLTVVSPAPPRIIKSNGRIRRIMQWNCRCECGNIRIASTNDLRSGSAHSCGCDSTFKLRKSEIMQKTVTATNGLSMTCKQYHNTDNMDVIFEDGTIVKGIRSKHFEAGNVRHPAFQTKLNADEFHGYKHLKPAFKYGDNQYYYCITPDGDSSIVNIKNMIGNNEHIPFISEMKLNANGLWMTITDINDTNITVSFEDNTVVISTINKWLKNSIRHPLFNKHNECRKFYQYQNLKPAFCTHDIQYYYCTLPDNTQTIMSLQEMLLQKEQNL